MASFCPQCGAALKLDARFCEECGARVDKKLNSDTVHGKSSSATEPTNNTKNVWAVKGTKQKPSLRGKIVTGIIVTLLGLGLYLWANSSSDLTRKKASALIEASEAFVMGDVVLGFMTYQGLDQGIKRGLFERTHYGLGVTTAGKSLFPRAEFISNGQIPVNVRLHHVAVAGITSESENERRVEFACEGRISEEIFGFLLKSDFPCEGVASLRLYDDGWRVQRLTKKCRVLPREDAIQALKREAESRRQAERKEAEEHAGLVDKSKRPGRTIGQFDQLIFCGTFHTVSKASTITNVNLTYSTWYGATGCRYDNNTLWFGDIREFRSVENRYCCREGGREFTHPGVWIRHQNITELTFPSASLREEFLQQLRTAISQWKQKFPSVVEPVDYKHRAHSTDIPLG